MRRKHIALWLWSSLSLAWVLLVGGAALYGWPDQSQLEEQILSKPGHSLLSEYTLQELVERRRKALRWQWTGLAVAPPILFFVLGRMLNWLTRGSRPDA
jgi:hypothetical protein